MYGRPAGWAAVALAWACVVQVEALEEPADTPARNVEACEVWRDALCDDLDPSPFEGDYCDHFADLDCDVTGYFECLMSWTCDGTWSSEEACGVPSC
jgi:hypothetical protein